VRQVSFTLLVCLKVVMAFLAVQEEPQVRTSGPVLVREDISTKLRALDYV
jgi:hypothetical protein